MNYHKPKTAMNKEEIIRVENLSKTFALRGNKQTKIAVDKVDLSIKESKSICLIGESGSGKTTLARLIVRLIAPDEGGIYYRGMSTKVLRRNRHNKEFCRNVQIIFQNPKASLNPLRKVGKIIADPMRIHKIVPTEKIPERIEALLEMVGLPGNYADKYSYELSGGECQRIYIARVLGLSPKLIIADELFSSVDVVNSAEILGLLIELVKRNKSTLFMITHDLLLARRTSKTLYVMHQGRIVEQGDTNTLLNTPRHPYTMLLLKCCLKQNGTIDEYAFTDLNSNRNYHCCKHYKICNLRSDVCKRKRPPLVQIDNEHFIACFENNW